MGAQELAYKQSIWDGTEEQSDATRDAIIQLCHGCSKDSIMRLFNCANTRLSLRTPITHLAQLLGALQLQLQLLGSRMIYRHGECSNYDGSSGIESALPVFNPDSVHLTHPENRKCTDR